MKESSIEKRLKDEIEKLGGKAYKFVSPGVVGVPDRIVLLPFNRVIFIELKAPGKKLSPIQEHRAQKLKDLGFTVYCIDSVEGITELIRCIKVGLI